MKETSPGRGADERRPASRHPAEATLPPPDVVNDDSFSEERFIVPPALPMGSWETDESESRSSRPSSRTSTTDRRKQFDTTTPTLIDEEYEREDDEEAEMVSLDRAARQYSFSSKDEEFSMRRTPGASMYKSESESMQGVSMRRTPGAAAMHRSAPPTEQEGGDDKEGVELGFALTLSTPVGNDNSKVAKPKGKIWESFSSHSASPSPILASRPVEQEAPSRPPLAPTPSVASRVGAPQGPFSFQPWARSQTADASSGSQGDRHGAFSPNILRLTEDIGNLLHEDEDDDFTLEIPNVFRGDGDGADDGNVNEDWAGSYVFEQGYQSRRQKPSMPRSCVVAKDEKPRRRLSNTQGSQTAMHTQHPKPRRTGNEVFEFGKAREERASPQLLNFGGAFAPPPQAQLGSFMRPVASASSDGFGYAAPFGAGLHVQHDVNTRDVGVFPFGMQSQSFDAYPPLQPHDSQPAKMVPSQSAPTSPAKKPLEMSDMQATAPEFVPRATMSPPPQMSSHHAVQYINTSPVHLSQEIQWPQTQTSHYEPQMEHGSWYAEPALHYNPQFSYPIQLSSFADARASMTPSPHMHSWHQPDPSMYAIQPVERMQKPSVAQHAGPTFGSHSGTESTSMDLHPEKRELKRGKRGKKKSKADKTFVGSKKGSGDGSRPGSSISQEGIADDAPASASEDPTDSKRAELVESPSTRIAFKDFYRNFRTAEKHSFYEAEEFALEALTSDALPESVHWRVYLELADLAKRSNRFVEARRLYQKICQLQPYASQGWLEYSKLEEECGHMNRVTNILHMGLEYCEFSENLLTRAVKHQEKRGNLYGARELLARLKHVGIEKVWKTVLEGALLEGRAGNVTMARRVLKYLMHHVPWYGPLYLEAYKLERDLGHPLDALQIVERGLHAIPRYGPLWFGAFRICEEMDLSKNRYDLPNAMAMIERATSSISKELVWKVHLEAGQMLERAAMEKCSGKDHVINEALVLSRQRLALTILTCPHNLRWKVWLAAARLELGVGNFERARRVFIRAHKAVPEKGKSSTLLECVRLEEFVGERELARAVLCRARVDYGNDWKVWLECILLEIRSQRLLRAYELCTQALELHAGTGRLWSALIQLSQFTGGDGAQHATLKRALNAVPKSGEVWCEGARIHLNPFSDTFDLERAQRLLLFASKFTPQYGDSFIECLRLEVLSQWLMPVANYIWRKTKSTFSKSSSPEHDDRLTKYITDVSLSIFVARSTQSEKISKSFPKVVYRDIVSTVRKKLRKSNMRSSIDLSILQLTCANADPNYGSLWFSCRRVPTDTPRRVFEGAAEEVADKIHHYAHVYLAAMLRRFAVLSAENDRPSKPDGASREDMSAEEVAREARVNDALLSATSLAQILNPVDPTTGFSLLESTLSGSNFVTALTGLHLHAPIEELPLAERRKALYGTDALFS